jgi:hypothetical protein
MKKIQGFFSLFLHSKIRFMPSSLSERKCYGESVVDH